MRFSSQRACGHRLCLLDQAIAARKSVKRMRDLVDAIWEEHPDACALMLTTTTRNRPIEQVGQMWFVTCPSCHSVIETGCQVYTKTSA